MSKHTPGPWKLKREGVVADMNGEVIATLGYRVTLVNAGECCEDDRNAILIAAAPEMLDALRHAESHIRRTSPPLPSSAGRALLPELVAAIAKAEGRE